MTELSPKELCITVTMSRDDDGPLPVRFALDHPLEFRNEDCHGFDISFDLDDPDGTGYLFPDNPADAMWVRTIDAGTVDACPTSPMHWDHFEAKAVVNRNRTLLVHNINGYEQDFAFTLRVTRTPGDPQAAFVDYDPIGSNQNGNGVSRK